MTVTRILPALALVAALIVAGCGDDSHSANSGSHNGGGNGADRAFAADMVLHHESALDMAKIAQDRGESPFVKRLADDIVRTQTKEITILSREDEALDTAGVTVGSLGVPEHMKGMDGDVATLKKADPFDPAFMEMMVTHHEGAIEMANAELKKGSDPELKALAQDIIDAQQREIDAMKKQLGEAGSSDDATPHGGGHSG